MKEKESIRVIKMFAYMFPVDRQPALTIAMEALEKQVAKKPVDRFMFKECPTCGSVEIEGCGYCPECGQKLKWSDEE